MSPLTLIKLAMAVMNVVKWITRRIDQKEWEASGYQKAMADSLAEVNVSVSGAQKATEKAKAMPTDKKKARLGEDT